MCPQDRMSCNFYVLVSDLLKMYQYNHNSRVSSLSSISESFRITKEGFYKYSNTFVSNCILKVF